MENPLLILTAVGLSAILVVSLVSAARYLTLFFFVCYTLPFLPLVSSIFGADSEFWTDGTFSYASSSLPVYGLALIWIVSITGMLLALLLLRTKDRSNTLMGLHGKSSFADGGRSRIVVGLVFPILFTSVISRFFFYAEVEAVFPGMDPLICFVFVFCWAFVVSSGSGRAYIYLSATTIMYIISQLISGDRDFFVFLFALGLFWMCRGKLKFSALLQIGLLGLLLVFFGVAVSMVRMDVEFSTEQLQLFLRYNSWNAIILPVLSMIEAEWSSIPILYGKTYFDLLVSALPSPIFYILEVSKPINIDNPADWFYIEGLGGIHVAGVGLRNFGLIGVFLQSLLFTIGLISTENMISRRVTFTNLFFFLLIAAAIMHTVWYGLIYLVNALVFYLVMVVILHLFELNPVRSFKTK